MLELRNLGVKIGPVPVLRDVSFSVESGVMAGLIGHNGAGKTSLMRAVMGLLASSEGAVLLDSTDLAKVPDHQRAHLGIGYMPEDRRLVPALTVEQNLLVPAWATDLPAAETRLEWVYSLIPELREFRDRPSTTLSGGQQKLVALGRAMLIGEKLLLLDEPTEGIAPVLARRILQVLQNLKSEGLAVLIAESNVTHLHGLLDVTFAIERGSVSRLS